MLFGAAAGALLGFVYQRKIFSIAEPTVSYKTPGDNPDETLSKQAVVDADLIEKTDELTEIKAKYVLLAINKYSNKILS